MAASVFYDRVYETTATTGIGAITMAGAVSSYFTFAARVTNPSIVDYCIFDPTTGDVEVGQGTWTTTLARTTIIASSNANAAVNFAAGTKHVFVTAASASLPNLLGQNTFTASQTFTGTANRFGTAVTADALADNMMTASATTQKALVIQMKAVQTAHPFSVQTSAGVATVSVQSDGGLIVDQQTGAIYANILDAKYIGSSKFRVSAGGVVFASADFATDNLTGKYGIGGGRVYLASAATDVAQFNNGTVDAFRDIKVRQVILNPVAIASLVAAATAGNGATAYVTDALTPTFGATVAAGGAVSIPVYSDGTNWKVG